MLFHFCGCDNKHNLFNNRVLQPDPNCSNPAKSIGENYRNVQIVSIEPISPQYHAERLFNTYRPEDAAYHIIAIGILKQDTPEVRNALLTAVKRFGNEPVPDGFDWPDLAEKFKSCTDPGAKIIDHSPGCRDLKFVEIVYECSYYLGCQNYIASEIESITQMRFKPETELDTLQFLSQQ